MNVDLSRFKVVYGGRVLNAVALDGMEFDSAFVEGLTAETVIKPNSIAVIVINEDGNIEIIQDETWRFQFIPNIERAK